MNHHLNKKIYNIAARSGCTVYTAANKAPTGRVKSKVINSIPSEQWIWGAVICYGWTVSAAVREQEAELCSQLHAGTQWRMCVCTGCLCVWARARGISFSEGVYSLQTLFFQPVFLSNCYHVWLCVSSLRVRLSKTLVVLVAYFTIV